jgi:tRNA pseudouridine13 synthase
MKNENKTPITPDWKYAWGKPLVSGILRRSADDFFVEEIAGFEPDAQGEHDFLLIKKTDTNTAWLARQLATLAGVPEKDVGFAGLKDRNAVTVQAFSVRRPGGTPVDWTTVDLQGVEILEITRNSRKLRRGAHKGNRFALWLRDIDGDVEGLAARLSAISLHGVPNYFGEQRFGHEFSNIELARSLIAGKRLRRDKRSIAISAARSWIFNDYLSQRIGDKSWNTIGAGELAGLDGSGSVFDVAEVDDDITRRCLALDIHPTGPMWGKTRKTRSSLAQSIGEKHTELASGLEQLADEGSRPLRLAVRDLEWKVDQSDLYLSFSLTRGGYATSVLREIARWQ